jgi:CRP-like cAMP-binding protein
MATREEIADAIAGMAMFADLARPQLLGVASQFDEAFFPKGARIVRQGLTGSGFYIILEGEADVVADGEKRATLARGDFFGEVSVLLGEPPIADVIATRPLRCILIGGPGLEPFLLEYPKIMFRMLQASARRLRGPARRG